MSHFTLLVIHDADDSLDTLLEPYDENREVKPYPSEVISLAQVSEILEKHPEYHGTDVPELLEDYYGSKATALPSGGYQLWSTYNPDSKWDWWVIGGRWAGALRLKPGGTSLHAPQRHWGDPEDQTFDPLACDSARKGDLDIAGMRDTAGAEAVRAYDEVHAIIDRHPAIRPWSEYVAEIEADTKPIEQAREEYHAQSAIVALKEQGERGLFWSVDPFLIPRQQYVADARAAAIPGFATLVDGEYLEPGRMGWWGMSTDTQDSRRAYCERVNQIIDAAPDDRVFTMLDLHI